MILKLTFLFGLFLQEISGHGMMLEPLERNSVWRRYPDYPKDYDDNGNNCGGFGPMYGDNQGRCGLCGDSWSAPHPQRTENTGTFGLGKVVGEYPAGSVLETYIHLTANHKGTFNYSLCVLTDPSAPETGEDCFEPLLLEDGSFKSPVDPEIMEYNNRVQLPNITCERCVFRWTWRGGNNWGTCDDGTQAIGCGDQETFRSCADITIV